MIDFHTHILPMIDDGSGSVEESIWLLEEEARQGVDLVVLTPHYYAEENSPVEFLKRRYESWKALRWLLRSELPRIRLGAEVQYFEGICGVEDIRYLRIVGTDMLLLEMPFSRWTDRMVDDVVEMGSLLGVQIVLAHIERYLDMQSPAVWNRLYSQGIWMQCNASSFENWKSRNRVQKMLDAGMVQFIGTDCHNCRTRRPNWEYVPERIKRIVEENVANRSLRQLDTDGIHLEFV